MPVLCLVNEQRSSAFLAYQVLEAIGFPRDPKEGEFRETVDVMGGFLMLKEIVVAKALLE
jgi:hypothetical protein